MKARVLDSVYGSPCNGVGCGCLDWIIDGDGFGRYWLLCGDTKRIGCCNTKDLPSSIEIEDRKGY